jgi:hypothetical protein
MNVRPFECTRLSNTHSSVEGQYRHIFQLSRRRFKIPVLLLMIEHKLPDSLAGQQVDARHTVEDVPLLSQSP